jgi:hypothetical protein
MELRNHPLMNFRGVRNWPPVWLPVDREITKSLVGEIGILRHVQHDARYNTRCRLVIEHEEGVYTGTLMFDDVSFCWLVTNILKSHIRRSIKNIGDLDLSYSL